MADASFVDTNTRQFQASTTLAENLLVYLTGGKLAAAGATTNNVLGSMAAPVTAADDYGTVKLLTGAGTHMLSAAGAITAGNLVYQAASGQVASSGTQVVGIALQTVTTAGDLIEVLVNGERAVDRSALVQEDAAAYTIPFSAFRKWDAANTLAVNTAASDDLAVVEGTIGTNGLQIQSADSGGTSVTAKIRCEFPIPREYVDGETVTLRVKSAMQVVADTSATLDASVYRNAAPTVDICATAAQSINSATAANIDFTLTPTNVVRGDLLNILLTVAIVDNGNAADYIQAILSNVQLLLDIKG